MADLKYDTDTMLKTATKYRNIAKRMLILKTRLRKHVLALKKDDWKSDAGTAFQEMYDDGWVRNIDKYVSVLIEMADQLERAAWEYNRVTAKIKELEGVSILEGISI